MCVQDKSDIMSPERHRQMQMEGFTVEHRLKIRQMKRLLRKADIAAQNQCYSRCTKMLRLMLKKREEATCIAEQMIELAESHTTTAVAHRKMGANSSCGGFVPQLQTAI